MGSGEYFIVCLTYANGVGKTSNVFAMLGAFIWGAPTSAFDYPIFTRPIGWPKLIRIITESDLVDDNGPVQRESKKWWPAGRYEWSRAGKNYNHFFKSDTGWTGEVMTYNQDPREFEGKTIGLNVFIEPPPQQIFNACLARQRMGGLNIIDATPLARAAWIKDEIIDVPEIVIDGKSYGKSISLSADIEENCKQHGKNGQLEHDHITQIVSRYDPDEVEARAHGKWSHLFGLVFKSFDRSIHVIEEMPDYHKKCYENGLVTIVQVMDPHDRKPFAIGWYALFPNDDVIVIAEHPAYQFHKVKSGNLLLDDYRHVILDSEKDAGLVTDYRLIDPNYGESPSEPGGRTVRQAFASPCRQCTQSKKDCQHTLSFMLPPDSIKEGHALIKDALGDSIRGVRPKLFIMSTCHNHVYAFEHYAIKENRDPSKGVSETPELVHKDFIDLIRYLYLSGLKYYPKDVKPQRLFSGLRRP